MRQDILHSFISPLRGRILCDQDAILVGNADGVALPSSSFPIGSLPNLTESKTWVGDASNRPVEQVYVSDATFVIRVPDANLPSAQALNLITPGLLKVVLGGTLAQAEAGTDYATTAQLALLAAQIELSRETIEDRKEIAIGSAAAATASAVAAAGSAVSAETSWHDTVAYVDMIYATGLNALPNHGDVNIQGYRVTNVKQSPEGDFDAVSFTFLRDMMNGQLEILFP